MNIGYLNIGNSRCWEDFTTHTHSVGCRPDLPCDFVLGPLKRRLFHYVFTMDGSPKGTRLSALTALTVATLSAERLSASGPGLPFISFLHPEASRRCHMQAKANSRDDETSVCPSVLSAELPAFQPSS
ncbi:hypothetical protein AcW2_000028 [Taiwanofungus camphoratus]|nr:hypothetical protein AcW2_000028 [Antrodia cinnamomea]